MIYSSRFFSFFVSLSSLFCAREQTAAHHLSRRTSRNLSNRRISRSRRSLARHALLDQKRTKKANAASPSHKQVEKSAQKQGKRIFGDKKKARALFLRNTSSRTSSSRGLDDDDDDARGEQRKGKSSAKSESAFSFCSSQSAKQREQIKKGR